MHESIYITKTPLNHRKKFGQYFTPSFIARIMVNWIIKNNPKTILDPAFGLGVFYDEIMKNRPTTKIKFTGYEIDSYILSFNGFSNNNNLTTIKEDYLKSNIGFFDGIVCNPPYMRFQKFINRHSVLPHIEKKLGEKIIGYSNISSVFLVKSLTELNLNGRLAYIMPFEFFNTGYGKGIKRFLLEKHFLKHIIIFKNEKDIFEDATTTICMLLCLNDNIDNKIKISFIKSKEEICNIDNADNLNYIGIEPAELSYNKKWSPIILSKFSMCKIPKGLVKASLYGSFKRGIATGANNFFALTKSKINKFKISNSNICKCITKSQLIKKPMFTEDDFSMLYENDKPVFCLNVKSLDEQSIIDYIKLGEQHRANTRYLTRKRNPWYKIEYRTPSPILFGVFNRGRFKVIRNYSSAINFTCFHAFYPNVLFGKDVIDKLFIYFLSDIGQNIMKLNKREYGDKLDKFEPGDLNECLCPNQMQLSLIKQQEVEEVLKAAENDSKLAIEKCNRIIKKIIKDTSFQQTEKIGIN